MTINPEDIYRSLVEAGEAWAEAQHLAEHYEETKKTLISQLAVKSEESSVSGRESYALRHPAFIQHTENMIEARKQANKARVRYDSAKILAELRRTQAANERAANRYAT
jgi:hypothetical protein